MGSRPNKPTATAAVAARSPLGSLGVFPTGNRDYAAMLARLVFRSSLSDLFMWAIGKGGWVMVLSAALGVGVRRVGARDRRKRVGAIVVVAVAVLAVSAQASSSFGTRYYRVVIHRERVLRVVVPGPEQLRDVPGL